MDAFRERALREDWLFDGLKTIVEGLDAKEVDWKAVRLLVSEHAERLSLYDLYLIGPGQPQSDDLEEVLSGLRFLTRDLSPRVLSIPPPQRAAATLPGNRISASMHAKRIKEIVTEARSAVGVVSVSD